MANSCVAKPSNKITLPKVLVASMLPHFLAPILPRLCLIAFRYSQPVLIRSTIRQLDASSSKNASNNSYTIIFMAIIVYVGLAVSSLRPLLSLTPTNAPCFFF